ncbi:methyltransferase domain-containing protein [Enterococcus malodoratus]|uniref:methyltransferase domain-containing protein n=1 Tax=Enterococcus malodoratus TaxID=71451 RepID=UPI0039AF8B1F
MSDFLEDLKMFWNDFAEEYENIQQESSFPIAEELRDFLLTEKILPCQTFLDLAGGSGRYLTVLQKYAGKYNLVDISEEMLKIAAAKSDENVQLIQQTQENFLRQNKQRYELIFSAMNPALQTKTDFIDFCRTSNDWCLLLRVVKDEDQLFSPYEEKNPELLLNERYKAFLNEEHIPYWTKRFAYTKTEEISRDFFQEYFADDFSSNQLAEITKKNFADKQQKSNQQFLDYELIYFHVPKAYNENGF